MALRRFVVLLSKNKFKHREFQRAFEKYGIQVLRRDPLPCPGGTTQPQAALSGESNEALAGMLAGDVVEQDREALGVGASLFATDSLCRASARA